MDKKTSTNKNETLVLGIVLAICLIILLMLIVALTQSFGNSAPAANTNVEQSSTSSTTTSTTTPTTTPNTSQYVELPNLEGMNLVDAKDLLNGLGIAYEIVPTSSKIPNKVERVEHSGTVEDGKTIVHISTTVKLHANEVGKDKIVYLTFDDGPTRDNTYDIVVKLQEYGITASFFVEGRDVERYPDRMEAIFNRGHVIACHSHTHEYADIYSSTDAFVAEVKQYENALLEAIGAENYAQVKKIIRFPGGTNNSYLTKEEALAYISAVRGLGYTVYDWTALTGDAELSDKNPQNLISYLDSSLTRAKNNNLDLIVLMHDNVYSNEALGEILDYLVAEGYYFDTIDNCPEYTFVEN